MAQILIEITSPMGRQLAVLKMPGEVLVKETSPSVRYSTDDQVARTIVEFIEQNRWQLYDREREIISIRSSVIETEDAMLTLDPQTFAAKEFRVPVVAKQYSPPLPPEATSPTLTAEPPKPPKLWLLFVESTIKVIVDALIGRPLHFLISLILAAILRIFGREEDQRKEI